jgi:hypothetical protein
MLYLLNASVMFIYLSWTNVIISGDTFFNTINKTSTSVIDGTYPTFALFTLVRYDIYITANGLTPGGSSTDMGSL